MKKTIIAIAAVLVTAATSHAQGLLQFETSSINAGINAPVFMPGSTTDGPGPAFSAALYLVGAGGIEAATLIPTSVTTFRDSANEVAQRYVTGKGVTVEGSPGGSSVTLLFRGWQTSAGSFEAARNGGGIWGESATPFTITLATSPATGTDTIGITGFTMVPEPSTITLCVLGAAALLLRRRK